MQHMGFAAFDADEVIFRQGDTGEHFYIILTGAVDVAVNDAGDAGEQVSLILLLLYFFCKHSPTAAILLLPAISYCCSTFSASNLLLHLYSFRKQASHGSVVIVVLRSAQVISMIAAHT